MTDERLTAYARLLLDWCLGVEPGWQVLVATTAVARPLAEELSRELGRREAWALSRIAFGAPVPVDGHWAAAAPGALRGHLAPLERELVDRVDASVFVLAPEEGVAWAPEAAAAMRAQLLAYRARGRAGEIPSVRCDYPCPAYARRAELPVDAYADLFYAACLRDWAREADRMRPVLALLDGAREVRIVAAGTDLTLSLAGRRGALDDGRANVPGGEAYWCPVEGSAEGEIRFDVPLATLEGELRGVRLRLREGVVVDAAADAGEEAVHRLLATDEGARRFGELGVGLNDGIPRPTRNVLFDEKLAGTVHLALGDGFPHLGGTNTSAVHADLVLDLRPGGTVWRDGEVVCERGRWAGVAAG